jgi:hypothetical protein
MSVGDKMQMKRRDINKTMFTPNSNIHAYKVVAMLSIHTKVY